MMTPTIERKDSFIIDVTHVKSIDFLNPVTGWATLGGLNCNSTLVITCDINTEEEFWPTVICITNLILLFKHELPV